MNRTGRILIEVNIFYTNKHVFIPTFLFTLYFNWTILIGFRNYFFDANKHFYNKKFYIKNLTRDMDSCTKK